MNRSEDNLPFPLPSEHLFPDDRFLPPFLPFREGETDVDYSNTFGKVNLPTVYDLSCCICKFRAKIKTFNSNFDQLLLSIIRSINNRDFRLSYHWSSLGCHFSIIHTLTVQMSTQYACVLLNNDCRRSLIFLKKKRKRSSRTFHNAINNHGENIVFFFVPMKMIINTHLISFGFFLVPIFDIKYSSQ